MWLYSRDVNAKFREPDMNKRQLIVRTKQFKLRQTFVISRASKEIASTVQVRITDADFVGRGECVPYPRYGETVEKVVADIESIREEVQAGVSVEELQCLLPAGPARAALDVALWDLESKRLKTPVWKLARVPRPLPMRTCVTLSLNDPEVMANAAKKIQGNLLKLKLGAPNDLERVTRIHEARPDSELILDGNEGMTEASFNHIAVHAQKLNVVMIEQPYPESKDQMLDAKNTLLAVCADESAHTSDDVEHLSKHYNYVNIKLDKTGGLTEAIKMIRSARSAKMGVMLGCMVSSSLSMAPAMTLSRLADYIDLDGPLWLQDDVKHGLDYKNSYVEPPKAELWG